MITIPESNRVRAAVTAHFNHLWPLIEAGREDPTAIIAADVYLRQVKDSSPLEYGVAMKMIETASGLSWAAIRDA